MRRSARLVNRRFGAVLGTCLLVVSRRRWCSRARSRRWRRSTSSSTGPLAWVVNTAVAAGALLITMPFVAGVVTLLYLDLRVRNEGLDIELAAARRLPV